MQNKWNVKKYDENVVSKLMADLNVDRIIAILLNLYGISNKAESKSYINPDLINEVQQFLEDYR